MDCNFTPYDLGLTPSHFQPVSILQEGEARVRWNGILFKIAEGESDQELSGHTSFEVFRH